ncbi:MAG: hypothetical protein QOK39_621 [Acidimicrobiaceae bacterium]|nr:hypothetical protein [Acidimicrobiaceae bacterium]
MEEPGSQPPSFMVDIDAESCEKRYRLRVASGALPRTFGGRCYLDLGHAPGVVGDSPIAAALGDDKDPGGSATGGLAGIAMEPIGLFG